MTRGKETGPLRRWTSVPPGNTLCAGGACHRPRGAKGAAFLPGFVRAAGCVFRLSCFLRAVSGPTAGAGRSGLAACWCGERGGAHHCLAALFLGGRLLPALSVVVAFSGLRLGKGTGGEPMSEKCWMRVGGALVHDYPWGGLRDTLSGRKCPQVFLKVDHFFTKQVVLADLVAGNAKKPLNFPIPLLPSLKG